MSTGAFVTVLVLVVLMLAGLWVYADHSMKQMDQQLQQIEQLRDMKQCAEHPTSCVEGTPYKYEA